MMFRSFAQCLTGTVNLAFAPAAAATATTNTPFVPTACSFRRHALAALETAVALYSCIASLPHAPKGTLIFTKIRSLASSYGCLWALWRCRNLMSSHWIRKSEVYIILFSLVLGNDVY
jgi:hypothetical protein